MTKFGQVNLQQWLQQAVATNPINPLKIKGLQPHRDLTTPPSSYSWRWSGLGVVCVVWVVELMGFVGVEVCGLRVGVGGGWLGWIGGGRWLEGSG